MLNTCLSRSCVRSPLYAFNQQACAGIPACHTLAGDSGFSTRKHRKEPGPPRPSFLVGLSPRAAAVSATGRARCPEVRTLRALEPESMWDPRGNTEAFWPRVAHCTVFPFETQILSAASVSWLG